MLEAYSNYHARGLEFMRSGGEVKLLVYDCHDSNCGGAGNRLAGMISAFYVAVATNRIFLVNHTSPFPLEDTLVPQTIQWNSTRFVPQNYRSRTIKLMDVTSADSLSLFSSIFDAHGSGIDIIRLKINVYYVAMALWSPRLIGPDDTEHFIGTLLNKSRTFSPCSVSEPRASHTFRRGFETLFRFSPEVLNRTTEMFQEIGFQQTALEERSFVGVHVRIGGRLKTSDQVVGWEDPKRHSLADLKAFYECARSKRFNMLKRDTLYNSSAAVSPHVPVVVFSDNVEFKQEMERLDSNVTFVRTTTLFHADRSHGLDARALKRGNVDAIAEMAALSRASCIVGSDSSFSGAAAAISVQQTPECFCLFHKCNIENYDFFEATETKTWF